MVVSCGGIVFRFACDGVHAVLLSVSYRVAWCSRSVAWCLGAVAWCFMKLKAKKGKGGVFPSEGMCAAEPNKKPIFF